MRKIGVILMIFAAAALYGETGEESGKSPKDSSEYNEQPLVISFGFGLANFPVMNEDSLVKTQLGMGSRAPRFSGVQTALLYSMAKHSSKGIQASSLVNLALEDLDGVQLSSILNLTKEEMEGLQLSALVNYAGDLEGAQVSACFNGTGTMDGIQVGNVNWAGDVRGAQVGVVNVAGTAKGVQLGVVNVADQLDGIALGLINLSGNGIVDTGVWYEGGSYPRAYTYLQSGSKELYTLLLFASRADDYADSDNFISGLHLGHRFSLGPINWDVDGGVKNLASTDELALYPSFRSVVELNIRRLGVFCGVNGVVDYPGSYDSYLTEGYNFDLMGNNKFKIYPELLVGVNVKLAAF
ncbi:MAG: hypothetical protein PQJ60_13150 [Spirochaetales bacterium]|nr:hypothetical protein [Spirochaetales bacterium]